MSKDRQPVILTTTSDHLSRAAEAILKRFPKDQRPDKNAILNDVAASLKPGKNWGGLLAEARSQPRTTHRPNQAGPIQAQIPARPSPGAAISAHVGAVERRIVGADGVIDTALFASPVGQAATADLIDGAFLAGIIVDIFEEQVGYGVLPVTTLLLIRNGRMHTIYHNRIEASPALSTLILEVLQEVWLTDWADLLRTEGITMAKVLVGPQRGAAVIPFETVGKVKKRQDVDELASEAVRFIVPEESYDAADTDILVRLTEMSLTTLAQIDAELVQIELSGRNPAAGACVPIEEEIPAPPWRQDYIVRARGGDWLSAENDQTAAGNILSYVLGEALAFVLDYHGVPFHEQLYIDTSACEMSPKRRTRELSADWRILTWRDGTPAEWRLNDPDRHALLRRQLEAWLVSERAEIKAPSDLPKRSIRILAGRSTHRNTSHWERAVEHFRRTA